MIYRRVNILGENIVAKLLNRKATKSYILEKCKKSRTGWQCQRVSKTALDEIGKALAGMANV